MSDIIEKIKYKKGEITSVLLRASKAKSFVSEFIDKHSDENILLWQKFDFYFPCKRKLLWFETKVVEQFEDTQKDFDILIVDHLNDSGNYLDTMSFMQKIREPKYKDNAFVILFTSYTGKDKVEFEDFHHLAESIMCKSKYVYVVNGHSDNTTIHCVKGNQNL